MPDFGSLHPLDGQARPQPIRMVRHRRHRAGVLDIHLGTGVTCPTVRMHPAIIAQSAATMPGRASLGVGSGENLNEHPLGDRWPETDVRQEMLEEASR